MPNFHRFTAIFFMLALASCASMLDSDIALKKNEKIFTPAELRADLKHFDGLLREIHPEPFARLGADKYAVLFEDLYIDLSWPQRRRDFYKSLSPLVNSLSDIHTRILYPVYEQQRFLKEYGNFPLAVLNSSDGLIVVADQQVNPQIPLGARLISINDIDIDIILKQFNDYVPKETQTGQRRMIQMEFASLLWSVYQFEGDYKIEYIWQNQKITKTVKGVMSDESKQLNSVVSHYGLISIDAQTSLIWLNDFNEEYDKFEAFLDQQFKSIHEQNKTNLILDLRYNQGGITDNLALLLTYLTSKPINWATQATLKLSDPFREQHAKLLNNAKNQKYGNYLDWLPIEYLNFWQWEILFSGDGELLETKIKTVVSEKQYYFTGKIIVLSNGYCFSACSSLIATLRNNNLATIVGESPGSLTSIQYGYPIEVELPNTGLQVIIPAIKFVLESSSSEISDAVVLPEHEIERRRLDVLLGRDAVFEYALELLK